MLDNGKEVGAVQADHYTCHSCFSILSLLFKKRWYSPRTERETGFRAVYSVGFALAELLTFAASSTSAVLVPYVASGSQKKGDALFTVRVIKAVLFVAVLAGFFLGLATPLILDDFSIDDYASAYLPVVLLLSGMVFLSIARMLAAYFSAVGMPQIQSYGVFVALAATVALDILLIPLIGIAGAAIASSLAYPINMGILLFYFHKIANVNLFDIVTIKNDEIRYCHDIIKGVFSRMNCFLI